MRVIDIVAWVRGHITGWIRGSLKYHYARKTAPGKAETLCGITIERHKLVLNDRWPTGSQICTKCVGLLCPQELQGNPDRCITCLIKFQSFYNRCHGIEAQQ